MSCAAGMRGAGPHDTPDVVQGGSLINRLIGYLSVFCAAGGLPGTSRGSGCLRCAEAVPFPAHRLDMYTSGVVIVAKQQPIVVRLHEKFRSGPACRPAMPCGCRMRLRCSSA